MAANIFIFIPDVGFIPWPSISEIRLIKQELRSVAKIEAALDKELESLELEEKRLDEIFVPLMSKYTVYQLIAKLRLEQYKRLMNDLQDVSAEEEGAENNFLLSE